MLYNLANPGNHWLIIRKTVLGGQRFWKSYFGPPPNQRRSDPRIDGGFSLTGRVTSVSSYFQRPEIRLETETVARLPGPIRDLTREIPGEHGSGPRAMTFGLPPVRLVADVRASAMGTKPKSPGSIATVSRNAKIPGQKARILSCVSGRCF